MLTRRGWSLIEVMIALVMLGVVGASLFSALRTQQRSLALVARTNEVATSASQAAELIASDLRPLAPARGDLYAIGATAVEYRWIFGATAICSIDAPRTTIVVPPTSAGSRLGVSMWSTTPEVGDSILVFDPGASADTSDDAWLGAELVRAPSAATCAMSSGLVQSAAESSRGFSFALSRSLPASVPSGSAVRVFRRARYELYRATDGRWYLGWLDCLPSRATACATVQPASGPFRTASASPPGLSLAFSDASGAPTANPIDVSLVEIVLRADAGDRIDSARSSVHPRS